jgi:hypothetical protein
MDAYMCCVVDVIIIAVVALQRLCFTCLLVCIPRCADTVQRLFHTMLTLALRMDRRIWLNGRAATAPFGQKHGRHDEKCDGAARKRLILTKDFE